jgi:type IV secretion system protein VirB2
MICLLKRLQKHLTAARPAQRRKAAWGALGAGALALGATPAFASTSSTTMPWDTILTNLQTDITGPIATAVSVIACVVFGLGMAMGQEGSAMKKGMMVLFGLSLAFFGSSALVSLFGGTSGATF